MDMKSELEQVSPVEAKFGNCRHCSAGGSFWSDRGPWSELVLFGIIDCKS